MTILQQQNRAFFILHPIDPQMRKSSEDAKAGGEGHGEEEKKRKDRGREQEEIRGGQACRQRGERMGSSRDGS